ncbi:IclR family transcriptional regulator [Herbiconiux sp. P18]|uniref:IclR family transcriptional regulator n=1 Tax=Herbiconiux liangxiaofengii TaxID=3342795 RepID=UPI0035B7FAD3
MSGQDRTPLSRPADLRARQPKAVHSALAVLEEAARCGPGVTARELSDNLGLPRATTYRLISLLVQDEFLVRMPDLKGFTLGRKVVELAHRVAPTVPGPAADTPVVMLPRATARVIDDLRAGIRGGVHLVGYHRDRMRLLDTDPDFPLSDERRLLGEYDVSAMGRLLVAELLDTGEPPPAALSAQARSTPRLLDEIRRDVRATGHAWQVGGFATGHGCLTVPIRGARGELVAGLTLSAPRTRVERPGPLLDQLAAGAAALSPLLSA